MTAWAGKACARCGARKGPKQADRKFCYRCALAERKDAATRAHRQRIAKTYDLMPGDYDRIYAFQGGQCAICRTATGRTRRLSVDHDHRTNLVRGLLCRPCNNMLGHARDDPEFFHRAIHYLAYPPARDVLNGGHE